MGNAAVKIDAIKGDDIRNELQEQCSYQEPLKESTYLPRGLTYLSAGRGE
jgi:hypothetical protein